MPTPKKRDLRKLVYPKGMKITRAEWRRRRQRSQRKLYRLNQMKKEGRVSRDNFDGILLSRKEYRRGSKKRLAKLRIRKMTQIREDSGCWEWQGSLNYGGYGQLNWGLGRDHEKWVTTVAHRYTWKLYQGKIPEGKEVSHLCHNRKCCNPDHLKCETHAKNMARARRRIDDKTLGLIGFFSNLEP